MDPCKPSADSEPIRAVFCSCPRSGLSDSRSKDSYAVVHSHILLSCLSNESLRGKTAMRLFILIYCFAITMKKKKSSSESDQPGYLSTIDTLCCLLFLFPSSVCFVDVVVLLFRPCLTRPPFSPGTSHGSHPSTHTHIYISGFGRMWNRRTLRFI